jgi:DNA polymerase-3 subunit gamma/tau
VHELTPAAIVPAMAKTSSTTPESAAAMPAAVPKPYLVLARKYRPQTFDDLIGQGAMVQTLRNAFAAGRIAQGFMLTGVRGVGKTTTARILARALNYELDGADRPTVEMPVLGRHCAEIMESRHPDVIEMDAASNTSVDNMREVIESARYKPILARYKVFVVDEVHMLSKSAFNALLKTLEEPPEHVKFIFATTEIRKVPVTVLSRCQRFDLRRVDIPELTQHFRRILAAEGATAEEDALTLIARAAEGSVRDGLSILDQAIAMGAGEVTAASVRAMLGLADRGRIFDLVEHVFAGEAGRALEALAALHRDGGDPGQILADLAEAVQLATRVKVVGVDNAGEGLSAEEKRRAEGLARRLSIPLLTRAWQMLVKGLEEAKAVPQPLAAAEMVLVRLAYTADLPAPDEIIKALGGGALARRATDGSKSDRGARGEDSALLTAAAVAPVASAGPERIAASPDGDADLLEQIAEQDTDGLGLGEPGAPVLAQPRSFADVVALAGRHRDARLKVHLEDDVSLVKFDAAAGSIDIFLLPNAPKELANDLREKLNRWTGRRWVVMLSKVEGAQTLGAVRREKEAAEIEAVKRHPAVAAVLAEFPDARLASVRPLARGDEDDTGTG